MKTAMIDRRSQELHRILKAARRDDVILRTATGDEVLMSFIDDFDYEVAAQRRNKKLMRFLEERSREAHTEKGIPLEEVRRRLGLRPRSPTPTREPEPMRVISLSKPGRVLGRLLAMVRSEDVLLTTAQDHEYALTIIREGDHKDARRRLSEVVMAYLDSLPDSRLPPLEVVFVRDRPPTKSRPSRRRKNVQRL
jgi:hypothetical protein